MKQIRIPKLSDKELIAINLTAEYMGIDNEYQLFRALPKSILSLIERSIYNRRKRKLFSFINQIRRKLADKFNSDKEYFTVDKGYLSTKRQLDFFNTCNIKLNTLYMN